MPLRSNNPCTFPAVGKSLQVLCAVLCSVAFLFVLLSGAWIVRGNWLETILTLLFFSAMLWMFLWCWREASARITIDCEEICVRSWFFERCFSWQELRLIQCVRVPPNVRWSAPLHDDYHYLVFCTQDSLPGCTHFVGNCNWKTTVICLCCSKELLAVVRCFAPKSLQPSAGEIVWNTKNPTK